MARKTGSFRRTGNKLLKNQPSLRAAEWVDQRSVGGVSQTRQVINQIAIKQQKPFQLKRLFTFMYFKGYFTPNGVTNGKTCAGVNGSSKHSCAAVVDTLPPTPAKLVKVTPPCTILSSPA
jgi:hypothetical protein